MQRLCAPTRVQKGWHGAGTQSPEISPLSESYNILTSSNIARLGRCGKAGAPRRAQRPGTTAAEGRRQRLAGASPGIKLGLSEMST